MSDVNLLHLPFPVFSPPSFQTSRIPQLSVRSAAWCCVSSVLLLNRPVNSPHKLSPFYLYNFLIIIFLINEILNVPGKFLSDESAMKRINWDFTGFNNIPFSARLCIQGSHRPPPRADKRRERQRASHAARDRPLYSFPFISSSPTSLGCLIKSSKFKKHYFFFRNSGFKTSPGIQKTKTL